jgi:hypothetical protein
VYAIPLCGIVSSSTKQEAVMASTSINVHCKGAPPAVRVRRLDMEDERPVYVLDFQVEGTRVSFFLNDALEAQHAIIRAFNDEQEG